MSMSQTVSLFLLRVSLGWYFFYAGVLKITDPSWSAAGYLQNAQTFAGMYTWFLRPDILPAVNWLNEWGLTLLGVALIAGIFVRLGALFGIVLMALYYFPVLEFPHIPPYSFVIDDHIIYAAALLALGVFHAGRAWGLQEWVSRWPICHRFPLLRNLIS